MQKVSRLLQVYKRIELHVLLSISRIVHGVHVLKSNPDECIKKWLLAPVLSCMVEMVGCWRSLGLSSLFLERTSFSGLQSGFLRSSKLLIREFWGFKHQFRGASPPASIRYRTP